MASHLRKAYGGPLAEVIVGSERAAVLRAASRGWPSLTLHGTAASDAEMIVIGAYSPLKGFMTRAEADSVREVGRLPGGLPWPSPITLQCSAELAGQVSAGDRVALRDREGVMLAALTVSEAWDEAGAWFLGGPLEALARPDHYDFRTLRPTVQELRAVLSMRGWLRTVAYHPQGVIGPRVHALTTAAARQARANLLLHAPVGGRDTADLHHYAQVRALRAVFGRYVGATTHLALLPHLARQDPAREALLRAIVARNFGCSHLLHDANDGGESRALLDRHAEEVGIEVIDGASLPEAAGTQDAPFPEVARELERVNPPPSRQGFTVFFTGLSGAGKSTVANVLLTMLLERGGRPVTLLDGDIVRQNLSSELGFSKEHRDLNVCRIGFVASEITKNGGVAICAPIAPYDAVRKQVRAAVSPGGGFTLVHVATPLDVCERRDRKGLYAKARAGLIESFTGISDPYEAPDDAEIVLDTQALTPEEAANEVLLYLEGAGYLAPAGAV